MYRHENIDETDILIALMRYFLVENFECGSSIPLRACTQNCAYNLLDDRISC